MSPRPRSSDKSIPISVALPMSLVRELDIELTRKQSRSKYIATAIKNRLDEVKNSGVETRSTRQLMAALSQRSDIDPTLGIILTKLLFEN